MRAIHPILIAGGVAALIWGLSACQVLPGYVYFRQADSASIVDAPTTPPPPGSAPTAGTEVEQIDGRALYAVQRNAAQKFLAPGEHGIGLYAWWVDDGYSLWEWEGAVSAEFRATHAYHFSVAVVPSSPPAGPGVVFDLTLWDETAGGANPVPAGEWEKSAVPAQSAGDTVVANDFIGIGFARPPLHDERPSTAHPEGPEPHRTGGLPPIPHTPRPPSGGDRGRGNHGGGGNRGGGSHGGGGGGGHKK